MALQVEDKIEVRVNTVWKPAVVRQLWQKSDGTDFLSAKFPDGHQQYIMLINEHTVWRYPDAPFSP